MIMPKVKQDYESSSVGQRIWKLSLGNHVCILLGRWKV